MAAYDLIGSGRVMQSGVMQQVPRDIRILRAKLEEERALGLQQALPPSTFATDVAAINGSVLGSSCTSSVLNPRPLDVPSITYLL